MADLPKAERRRPSASPRLPAAPSEGHPVTTMRRQRDEDAPPAPAPAAPPAPPARGNDEPVVQFSARVPRSLRHRARVYGLEHDMELQDIVVAALTEYFDRHDG